MNVSLQTFGGLIPRIAPSLLPETGATVANNCRLRSGKCSPLKQSLAVTDYIVRLENALTDMADAKTLHLWKRGTRKEFLGWPGHVTVAAGNIFDDDRYRVFVAGETGLHGTEVTIPVAPALTPLRSDGTVGAYTTDTFVQVFVGAAGYSTTHCSSQSSGLSYSDGVGGIVFDAVATPPASSTARVIYKVISVVAETGVATLVTQAAWSQAIVVADYPAFTVALDSSLDSATSTRTILAAGAGNIAPARTAANPSQSAFIQNQFVQTYVDSYGRESACSTVSAYVTYIDNDTPVNKAIASAISSPPADAMTRRFYRVLGIYGDKIYCRSKAAWKPAVNATPFGPITLELNSTTDDAKQTLYFTEQNVNQPCAYVSAIDSGGFDRHPICLEKLPDCGVTRTAGSPNTTLTTNLRYTFFFQTWVDEYGYESACSDPSGEIIYNDGDQMGITAVSPCPPGAAKRRVYKVVTGTDTESIQFVWEQDVGTGEFDSDTFTVKDENAADILVSMTMCPKDLCWIVNMPGNFFAGFATGKKRQICFSEIEIPTSWPLAYRYDIREDAVGLAVSGTTLFVLTVGQPYAISGTDPKGMTVSRIASNQGCVSKYSICSMNNAVFYASQDGVCMLSEGSQTEIVITKDLFLQEQWMALNPSSCLMVAHDTALHMFFTKTDGTKASYILDMIDSTPVLTTHDDVASAVYADVESDGLYMIKEATV